MKSSTGVHFIALDHVRALAAFMVFVWHFSHGMHPPVGYPVGFEGAPGFFPFSIFDEGHTGVALFMTLSGYLFAKLLDGKRIHYGAFLWNRILRLAPLLLVVIVIVGVQRWMQGTSLTSYAYTIAKGVVLPALPNGGWSITVEFHYYAILPLFLWLLRKSKWLPLVLVGAAILLRVFLRMQRGEIQTLAYWTIVGRMDQFALGMLAFQFRGWFTRRHVLAALITVGFTGFYWFFDRSGGFHQSPSYPSPSSVWIWLPTLEGLVYGALIAWYEGSFQPAATGFSKWVGKLGEYSYSIYLLHFFFVEHLARWVHERVMDISNFYLATGWALVFFVLMLPLGAMSFRWVEGPFLKLRKKYILGSEAPR